MLFVGTGGWTNSGKVHASLLMAWGDMVPSRKGKYHIIQCRQNMVINW